MSKYVEAIEVFAEIPDEITLAISISGCPIHCKGCHSKYLWEDVGEELNTQVIGNLIEEHPGITCICFMGGDANPKEIDEFAQYVNKNYPEVKIAWYSGYDSISNEISLNNFDYIKIGPYIEERGDLTKRTTNQILYKVIKDNERTELKDITEVFWKK